MEQLVELMPHSSINIGSTLNSGIACVAFVHVPCDLVGPDTRVSSSIQSLMD